MESEQCIPEGSAERHWSTGTCQRRMEQRVVGGVTSDKGQLFLNSQGRETRDQVYLRSSNFSGIDMLLKSF